VRGVPQHPRTVVLLPCRPTGGSFSMAAVQALSLEPQP